MGDLKPLGSEKLHGDDKLKRILELTYYNDNKTKKTNNKSEYITESSNGVYGIVKEKDGYYVKKGINESTLDYIGGLFMKNKNKFSSYAEALKRLELLKGQELQEATKYVLKQNKGAESAPPPMPADDAPAPAPTGDMGGDMGGDLGGDMGGGESGDIPPSDEMDMPPAPEDGMGDEGPMDDPAITGGDSGGGEEEKPAKRSDYMSEVQRSSGKLGQSLRDVKERMESDDIKYVINMILSAIDMNKLSKEDRDDIADRFNIEDDEVPVDDMGDDESEFSTADIASDSGDGEDVDIEETMNKLANFINTPSVRSEEVAYGEYADIQPDRETNEQDSYGYEGETNEQEQGDDVVELDLDEIKNEINRNISSTLSKYFK